MQRVSPSRRGQRGVSLIEILVVLVVLVLGILIIIRLYPSGFFSLESVGNSALADSIGGAAVQAQVQNSAGLPESIFPGTLLTQTPAAGDFDPDDPTMLNKACLISNETITVPSQSSGGALKSIYVVNYGPIVLGTPTIPLDPAGVTTNLTQLPNYLTINSVYWQALSGSAAAAVATPPIYPQDELADDQAPGQQRFLVDYAQGQIAVPYAQTFPQTFTLLVVGSDNVLDTVAFTVPASGSSSTVTDPHDPSHAGAFLSDSATYYNGGWFDPVNGGYNTSHLPGKPPTPWRTVMLYRPFKGIINTAAFSKDPYEFMLTAANLTTATAGSPTNANVGAVSFNPLAAGSTGIKPLKAQISYQTYDWGILHEDRDVAAISSGTTAARLTLKNLLYAGAAQQDNTIFTGLAGGNQDLVILNLDTGLPVGTAITNEDTNGPTPGNINVSYATGRVTFPSTTFGANTAGRVRIFYAGDADWTVAVQKAPAMYGRQPDVSGGDPMLSPGQFAFDYADNTLLFPHCDYGKTIEIDGLIAYDANGVATAYPNITTVIGKSTDLLSAEPSAKYWRLSDLAGVLPGTLYPKGPNKARITIAAVRGLSARAVVAWKERNQWKVHSVDTVLTRTP